MGAVWKARDPELDRIVAVKIPRKGHLDPQETEHFLREARAAAQLRHPNIVSVHEVGREQDTLYIVSDFVRGATLADWLTGRRPTPRQAAELCVTIAEALHHAHEAGVIHRDLKPGNIMLDAQGEPHLMDFGLAKREAGEITMTVDGRILGTPAYMSPEQARGEAHHADRRSDIYSLGVILFQLLTGELPFRGNARMLVLQIQDEEPPRPRKLDHRIPRDLETICLKCLEKHTGRRYQTAADLGADLRRWLNGEPILARPIGRVERAWRWCRRKPALAATGTLAAAALLAVAVISATLAALQSRAATRLRQEQSSTLAALDEVLNQKNLAERRRQEADEQRKLAEQGRQEAELERKRAEANLQKARKAVDQLLTHVAQDQLANVPQMEPLRRALLEDALKFYQGFLQDYSADPTVRHDTANAWRRSGSIERQLGNFAVAEESYREAIKLLEVLAAADPTETEYRAALAEAHLDLGSLLTWLLSRHQEADTMLRRALSLQEELAAKHPNVPHYQQGLIATFVQLHHALFHTGGHRDAEEALHRALDLSEKLVADFPDAPDYRMQQSDVLLCLARLLTAARDRPHEAEQTYRQSLKVAGDSRTAGSWQLFAVHHGLANHLRDTGRPGEAEEAYREALRQIDKLVADSPAVPALRVNRADTHVNLGILLARANRFSEAEECYRTAIAILQDIVPEFPAAPWWQQVLHETDLQLGQLLATTGRHREAEQHYRAVLARAETLVEKSPNHGEYRRNLAEAHLNLGLILCRAGQPQEVEECCRIGLDQYENLASESSLTSDERRAMSSECLEYGYLLAAVDSPQAAELGHRRAVVILEKLLADSPDELFNRSWLAGAKISLGALLAARGQFQEAEQLFRWAIETEAKLSAEYPNHLVFQQELAGSHFNLGLVLLASGRREEAEQNLRQALAIRERLVALVQGPGLDNLLHGGLQVHTQQGTTIVLGQPCHHSALAETLYHLAVLLADRGQPADARQLLERAMHHQQAALEFHPSHPNYRRYLLNHYWSMIQTLSQFEAPLEGPQPTSESSDSFRDVWETYYRANGALTGCGTLVEQAVDLYAVEQRALDHAPDESAKRSLHEVFQRTQRKPSNPVEQNNLAWLLAARPDAELRDPARAVELAMHATSSAPQEARYWTTLGVSHYRSGDSREAIAAFEQAMQPGNGDYGRDFYFLAMAHWQLGDKVEALTWYDKGVQSIEKNQPDDEELRRFQAEAAALLEMAEQLKE